MPSLTEFHEHILFLIKSNLFKVFPNQHFDRLLVPVLRQLLAHQVGLGDGRCRVRGAGPHRSHCPAEPHFWQRHTAALGNELAVGPQERAGPPSQGCSACPTQRDKDCHLLPLGAPSSGLHAHVFRCLMGAATGASKLRSKRLRRLARPGRAPP